MNRILLVSTFFLISMCGFSQDNVGFNNPYQVIYNHLANLQDDNYFPEIASRTFSGSIDSVRRIELAKMMKRVYDGKGLYVHVSRITKDSLYRDTIAKDYIYFPFPKELPDVYLEKENGNWIYSLETTKLLPGMYEKVYPLGLSKTLDWMPQNQGKKFFGLYLWQMFGLAAFFLLLFILYYLFSRVFNFIISRITRRIQLLQGENSQLLKKIDDYIILGVLASVSLYILPVLRLPVRFSIFLQKGFKIAFIIIIMLMLLAIVDVLRAYLDGVTEKTESKLDEQLLPILIKFLKIFICIGATFQVLHLLEVNITALIAGISIGGLALALAAQDTVKNLIGSMMIFFDKPFQIGDYIIANDMEGSVVEVGFRSTRIKKIDTSITSVPNGNLVNASLTNLGVRNFRLLKLTLGLMYDTPSTSIQQFINDLRTYVDGNPNVYEEGKYIHLIGLNDSSIDIMFRVYLNTLDYAEELMMKEEVIFEILKIAERNGVSFAFPSSSVYIEQMPKQH